MKRLFLVLPSTTAQSQTTTPPAAGGNDRFKQLDKNADGKLSEDELPAAPFERLDVNKDGFVTAGEAKASSKPKP